MMGHPTDVPQTVDEPSVARLVQTVDGSEVGYCTVFKLDDNHVMTAGHCCGYEEGEDISDVLDRLDEQLDQMIKLFDKSNPPLLPKLPPRIKKPKKTHVIGYYAKGPYSVPGAAFEAVFDDDVHDVCVLRGKLRGAPLALAASDPPRGGHVWTAGFPQGVYLVSEGLWSGRRDNHDDAIASIGVWQGASGSPVLDAQNHVVGVTQAFFPPMSNLTIITPLEYLRTAYTYGKTK